MLHRTSVPSQTRKNTKTAIILSIAATIGVVLYGIAQNLAADPNLSGWLTPGIVGGIEAAGIIDIAVTGILGYAAYRKPRYLTVPLAGYFILSRPWLFPVGSQGRAATFSGQHMLYLLLFALGVVLGLLLLHNAYTNLLIVPIARQRKN
jgi:hypothetical protein